jgi:hypothetical protein
MAVYEFENHPVAQELMKEFERANGRPMNDLDKIMIPMLSLQRQVMAMRDQLAKIEALVCLLKESR